MAAAATVRACDCGRSNCKKLVDELGVPITVCYLPPGTSKWNKIEHRLFSFITGNWRSKPLVTELMLGLGGHPMQVIAHRLRVEPPVDRQYVLQQADSHSI